MKDLINDRIDSTAYYLQRIEYEASPTSLNWFQAAHDYLDTVSTLVLPHKTEALDLLDEFNGGRAIQEKTPIFCSPRRVRTSRLLSSG